MSEDVLATVEASATRRWMAIGMLGFIGVLVLYVAFASPPQLGWQLFLIASGGLAIWGAELMRRATEHRIELTETEIRDSSGMVIVRVEDIEKVDRGLFAFKPSNGFLVVAKSPLERIWRPGLWWRFGRRIGVGGVTPAAQTKVMAEMLTALLVQPEI